MKVRQRQLYEEFKERGEREDSRDRLAYLRNCLLHSQEMAWN